MPGRKKFAVHWANSADADLAAIVDYLAAQSPENAERVLDRIEETASRLALFPGRGRIVPELRGQGILIYRELVCRPWRIIYRIEGKSVWIMAVIDGRRNLEDLLLERFLR